MICTSNMSPPPHLQLFNSFKTTHEESALTVFPSLPAELRLKIWRHCIERERLITVYFTYPFNIPARQTDTQVAESTGNGNGDHYRIAVDGYQLLSRLLRVNREAREAALAFYQVHLPCELILPGDSEWRPRTKPGILYFNPGQDFLRSISEPHLQDTLVDLIYRLKVCALKLP
jgi:hypothetical protein